MDGGDDHWTTSGYQETTCEPSKQDATTGITAPPQSDIPETGYLDAADSLMDSLDQPAIYRISQCSFSTDVGV